MIDVVIKMSAAACLRLARLPTTPRHLALALQFNALGFYAVLFANDPDAVMAVLSWLSLA